jgi:PAS domain S-box-containing protein
VETYTAERLVVRKDGTTLWCQGTTSLVRSADGTPAYLIVAVEDISTRKQLEGALRESETRLRSVTANVPGMMYRLWHNGADRLAFVYVSDGGAAVSGLSPEALRADAGRLFALMEPADREVFRRGLEESAQTLAAFNWEGRLRFGTDDVKWVNFRAVPIITDDGVAWDGIALNITETKRLEAELRGSRAQLEELMAHLELVREEERARIAREVHDELGQWLTVLKMDAAWFRDHAKVAGDQRMAKATAMAETVDTVVNVVRRIAADLRPAVFELGLFAALEWIAEEFEKRTGIACRFEPGAAEPPLDKARIAGICRVVQESLTNVARHAGASRTVIALHQADGMLEIEVSDNGKGIGGMDMQKPGHFGLLGIRERAHMMGGTVHVSGAPGDGTRVRLCVPLGGER